MQQLFTDIKIDSDNFSTLPYQQPKVFQKKSRMKPKTFLMLLLLSVIGWSEIIAQKPSSNDDIKAKVSVAVERLDEAFKLDKDKKSTIEDIFQTFYQEQQKLKNNIQRPASGMAQGLAGQNFQNVRKRNDALIEERDKQLKKELSAEQFKKWIGEIEPSLHKKRK